jgi:hypothetical protein
VRNKLPTGGNMQELFFTNGVKKELTHRIIQILNVINDIDYAVRDNHSRDAQLGEIFTATRVANRLYEEIDNAEIIG